MAYSVELDVLNLVQKFTKYDLQHLIEETGAQIFLISLLNQLLRTFSFKDSCDELEVATCDLEVALLFLEISAILDDELV